MVNRVEFSGSHPVLRNVLFAMDFSPTSLRAYPFAAGIALHNGGKLRATHIVPEEDSDTVSAAEQERIDQLLRTAMIGGLGAPGVLAREEIIDHGEIGERLVAAAADNEIDLIVMGTHGWRGIDKLFHGSTTEAVARLATKPILTVGPKVRSYSGFRRILYGTDFLPAAAHALPYAMSVAESYDADLLVLHVNDGDNPEPPVEAESKTFKFLSGYLNSDSNGKIAKPPEVIVDFRSQTEAILGLAETRQADLIVMGLRPWNNVKARIAAHLPGTIMHEVISQSHCPVMIVSLQHQRRLNTNSC